MEKQKQDGVAGSAADIASGNWTGISSTGSSKPSRFRPCESCIQSSDIASKRLM